MRATAGREKRQSGAFFEQGLQVQTLRPAAAGPNSTRLRVHNLNRATSLMK
jgi:hypothetical protein